MKHPLDNSDSVASSVAPDSPSNGTPDGMGEAEFLALAMALHTADAGPLPLRITGRLERALSALHADAPQAMQPAGEPAGEPVAQVPAAARGASSTLRRARAAPARLRAVPSPTTTQGATYAARAEEPPVRREAARGMRWYELTAWAAAACIFGGALFAWRSAAHEAAAPSELAARSAAEMPISLGGTSKSGTRLQLEVRLQNPTQAAAGSAAAARAALGWIAQFPAPASNAHWVLWQRTPALEWRKLGAVEPQRELVQRLVVPVSYAAEASVWASAETDPSNQVPDEATLVELKRDTKD